MKMYSVYVTFRNGQDFNFQTVDDVRMLQPIYVGEGMTFLLTSDQYAINLHWVEKMEVVELY